MTLIVLLIVGALIGWAASMATRREAPQDVAFNLAAGIGGALLGSLLLAPLLEVPVATSAAVDAAAVQMAMLGAIPLLAAVNLVRRPRAPRPRIDCVLHGHGATTPGRSAG